MCTIVKTIDQCCTTLCSLYGFDIYLDWMSYLDLIYGLHLGLEPDAGRTELRIGILIEHFLFPKSSLLLKVLEFWFWHTMREIFPKNWLEKCTKMKFSNLLRAIKSFEKWKSLASKMCQIKYPYYIIGSWRINFNPTNWRWNQSNETFDYINHQPVDKSSKNFLP